MSIQSNPTKRRKKSPAPVDTADALAFGGEGAQ